VAEKLDRLHQGQVPTIRSRNITSELR
jgi:hypothetical protein